MVAFLNGMLVPCDQRGSAVIDRRIRSEIEVPCATSGGAQPIKRATARVDQDPAAVGQSDHKRRRRTADVEKRSAAAEDEQLHHRGTGASAVATCPASRQARARTWSNIASVNRPVLTF